MAPFSLSIRYRIWRSQLWSKGLGEPLLGAAEGREGKVSRFAVGSNPVEDLACSGSTDLIGRSE